LWLKKKYQLSLFSSIFGLQNPGSGSVLVVSLKCRIRMEQVWNTEWPPFLGSPGTSPSAAADSNMADLRTGLSLLLSGERAAGSRPVGIPGGERGSSSAPSLGGTPT
jgi:hypothetical protein